MVTPLFQRRNVLGSMAAVAVASGAALPRLGASAVVFPNLKAARSARVGPMVRSLRVAGFAAAGDGGAATYVRKAAGADHPGRLRTADGTWWELDDAAITPQMFGAVADGVGDCRPSLQSALAAAAALNKPLRPPSGVYRLTADPRAAWCLSIPSNAFLDLSAAPLFRAQDQLPAWKRVISIIRASGVRIRGVLRVDGNACNIAADHNEHMHGVFLFDCADTVIDAIEAVNCRGDNVFIGGTDDTAGSRNVRIGNLHARKAGRKNLVLGACQDVRIDTARLDNREGGAKLYGGTPDQTDGNCLDVEPDLFTGRVENSATIHRLTCFGAGLDFTAGVSPASAERWTLRIGELNAVISPRPGVPAWTQYGITVMADRIRMSGLDGTEGQSNILYAARLDVDDFTLTGARKGEPILLISQVGGHQPVVRFRKCAVTNLAPGGMGIENRDSVLRIEEFTPATTSVALWNRGLSPDPRLWTITEIVLARLDSIGDPSGLDYALLSTKEGAGTPRLRIQHITHRERRSQSIGHLIHFESGTAAGATIQRYDGSAGVPLANTALRR